MSMPSFPPKGADMTKEEALTMIVASIAMEEAALSHILNAEGEKLPYILGTLPGSSGTCSSTREVLELNRSVKDLLDAVTQNQMLLKEKLEKALEAGGYEPPEPPHPCGPSRPDQPSCGGPCREKSALRLVSRSSGLFWDNGCLMSWKCREQRGRGIGWNETAPALVSLDPEKAYLLSCVINIRAPSSGDSAGAVCVKLTPCGAFPNVLPLYFSLKCLECKPLTLHYSTTLFPREDPPSHVDLSLLLKYRERLFVEQASLSIVEI